MVQLKEKRGIKNMGNSLDCLASLERINDSIFLFSRRINAIPIHQQAHSQVIL